MRAIRRRSVTATIGGAAALGSLIAPASSFGAANPGQAINNDYGQSAAEVNAEVASQVAASSRRRIALANYSAWHKVVLARGAAEAKAKANYRRALRTKRASTIRRAKRAYYAARDATVRAKRSEASARSFYLSVNAATIAAVRAVHFQPKDGTFTGAAAQYFIPGAGLEPIQVAITVYGGHVSDVTVPQYVSTGDSGTYNAVALPVLMQATMTAHDTANVAVVTGASLTSGAFRQSLQSALTSAGFKP